MTTAEPVRTTPRWQVAGLAALGALAVLSALAFHGVRADDAFITFRYGQNLALGRGPVFNPGEPVLGSTSAGQLLLSALMFALVGEAHLPDAMAVLGVCGWFAQVAAIHLALREAVGPRVALAGALPLAVGLTSPWGFVPLETHVALALSLWGLWLAARGRAKSAALACALAGLMRPDAYLMAALLGLVGLWKRPRAMLWPAVVFVVASAPWPLFAWRYYGSPLPQSLFTKAARSDWFTYLNHELIYLPRCWLPIEGLPPWLRALLGWPLALAGALWLLRRGGLVALLPVYGFVHLAAYLLLRPFTQHVWHLYPATATLGACLCVALGAAALGRWRDATRARLPIALRAAAASALLVVTLAALASSVRFAREYHAAYWVGARDAAYREVAEWLVDRADAQGRRFAAVEVGTLAYYSDLPAFDLGGLVTRPGTPLDLRSLRFLVLDRHYLRMAPPIPPALHVDQDGFEVFVYDLRAAPGL